MSEALGHLTLLILGVASRRRRFGRRRRLSKPELSGREDVVADVQKWKLTGDWFDVCKCTIPCPCTFAQAPSEGDCEGVLAWHVREGRYGDVRSTG